MTDIWIQPMDLTGPLVQLEPLGPQHIDGLSAAAADPSIWTWMPVVMTTRDDMARHVEWQMERAAAGEQQGWAVRHRPTNELCGGTAYLNVAPDAKRLEIGWTWYAPRWQRTGVNTGAKTLLLTHAFEALGANRVEFKTDAENVPSRTAIARLGAVEEGTLRHHMIRPDGTRRDSVYFSVIAEEWPAVKERLEALAHPRR